MALGALDGEPLVGRHADGPFVAAGAAADPHRVAVRLTPRDFDLPEPGHTSGRQQQQRADQADEYALTLSSPGRGAEFPLHDVDGVEPLGVEQVHASAGGGTRSHVSIIIGATLAAARHEADPVVTLPRIGIGYDLHRTATGRRLVLGGVEIPCGFGLAGHSDADVVLHAICDALLGAAALGDIGEHFPDDDPRWKDADSRRLLAVVLRLIQAADLAPAQVDLIIHAERPKLRDQKPAIRASVAGLLGLPEQRVSVKATTNEGLGPIGRGEAIACWAVVVCEERRAK